MAKAGLVLGKQTELGDPEMVPAPHGKQSGHRHWAQPDSQDSQEKGQGQGHSKWAAEMAAI